MRRTLPALVAAGLLLAACGDNDADSTGTEPDATEPAATAQAEDEPPDATEPDATEPAEQGDDSEKPKVEVPAEPPTELVVETLIEGDGPQAQAGDTVVVDYVGVRSTDGVEFDSSYDRGQPLTLTLGSGGVIDGWELGLTGVQAGQRVQLDIPSDLAYGDQARGDVIGENEDLTFVIDVRMVIPPIEPPAEGDLEASEGAETTTWNDLSVGEGDPLAEADTAVFHFALYRGDSLQLLDASWQVDPQTLPMEPESFGLTGLYDGMIGMQAGGRRAITIPPEEGFGPDGSPTMGLPADTDIIIVIDLLAIV